MKTDYKFWYIKRDDNGFITEVAVRFYEGEYQTIDGEEKYVRTKRLAVSKGELNHLAKEDGNISYTKEITEKEAIVYRVKDFGQIKTDDEIRVFLNKEIAKDKGREVIDAQKI